MRFKDKVCLVTGGGSGIGRAACLRFAQEGGKVAVVDLNPDHGTATAQTIAEKGGDSFFVQTDVGQPSQITEAISRCVKKWNRIDVLVNDAAMMTFKPVLELTESDWDKVLAVNLRSVFLFCKLSIPHMPKGGAIVNISSVHAHETTANVSPYVASKGGMEAFVRALAIECQGRKVRVNCVAPGAVNTPMLWNNPNVKSGKEKVQGAIGEPEDIAAAICFLAAPEARFINGTTLVVDGARLDIL
ncbi:MAG TPA: SDR family oxidoreductase [Tepidisphaeraceae bacterium]|nr:SDR family oxidoreductase [Tepidisphaeraceae bacterium]